MKAANCVASIMCAKIVRVDVAVRAVVRPVRVAVIRALRAVARREAQAREATKAALRVARTAAVATISHLRRTAMIGQRAVPAVVIAVVQAAPTLGSRVRIRHVPVMRIRATQARRVMQVQASRMGKAVRRARAALLPTLATRPNSAVGMCPRASTPARVRRDRAAIPMRRVRSRAAPAQGASATRMDSVHKARRAAPDSMPARTNNVRSLRARKASAYVASVRKSMVNAMAHHAARTPAQVVMARKVRDPVAIVQPAIIQVGNIAAPGVHRRTPAHMASVRIDPATFRAALVMKDCRVTRIDSG